MSRSLLDLRFFDSYSINEITIYLQINFSNLNELNLHVLTIKMLCMNINKCKADLKGAKFFESRLTELLKNLNKKEKITYKCFEL